MLGIGILMGIAGTLAMDVWAVVLNRIAQIPGPNWGAVGRWVVEVSRGRVFHASIGDVAEEPGEVRIGWAFHYLVGAIYGLVFMLLAGADWLNNPTFLPVWAFSLLTIGFGWFLLQPGLGLGWAASKTDTPWRARGLGLLAHTVFGLGMWGLALAVYAGTQFWRV